jgi:hypothetical protein
MEWWSGGRGAGRGDGGGDGGSGVGEGGGGSGSGSGSGGVIETGQEFYSYIFYRFVCSSLIILDSSRPIIADRGRSIVRA